MEEIRNINIGYCNVILRENGIVEQHFLKDTPYVIDAKEIQEIADAVTLISDNKPRAILSVAGLYGSLTPEARSVDISKSDHYTIALALVINELSQRLLANFYFKIKKVSYPVKTFKTEADAHTWLAYQIELSKKVG